MRSKASVIFVANVKLLKISMLQISGSVQLYVRHLSFSQSDHIMFGDVKTVYRGWLHFSIHISGFCYHSTYCFKRERNERTWFLLWFCTAAFFDFDCEWYLEKNGFQQMKNDCPHTNLFVTPELLDCLWSWKLCSILIKVSWPGYKKHLVVGMRPIGRYTVIWQNCGLFTFLFCS